MDKLSALSDQLAATVSTVSELNAPQRSQNTPDKDRSMNVIVFGVPENRDASVWRQSVLRAFQHVLGRDVETVDMFRLGRYNSDKVRPIVVRLRSVWDRRLLVNGAFKLKNFDCKLFIKPDESMADRRKRQLNSLKASALRDGKLAVVDNGVLSVDGRAVFSLTDGSLESSGARYIMRRAPLNGGHVDGEQGNAGYATLVDDEVIASGAAARGTGGSIPSYND